MTLMPPEKPVSALPASGHLGSETSLAPPGATPHPWRIPLQADPEPAIAESHGSPAQEADSLRFLSSEVAAGRAVQLNAPHNPTAQFKTHNPYDPPDPKTGHKGTPQYMGVWRFSGDVIVRYKPYGDKYRDGVPMFSIEVVEAGKLYYNLQEIAFKVDSLRRPVPKTKEASALVNPYNAVQGLFEDYRKHVMALGHHALRW